MYMRFSGLDKWKSFKLLDETFSKCYFDLTLKLIEVGVPFTLVGILLIILIFHVFSRIKTQSDMVETWQWNSGMPYQLQLDFSSRIRYLK